MEERLSRLEIPFDAFGVDAYGISRRHLSLFFRLLEPFYRSYFRVRCFGLKNVPPRGRAMLVGNHSGGVAIDGAMVLASMFFDLEPPRLAQGMLEKFINRFPIASLWSSRLGQFTGLPEHALRLLQDERLLMVFPEGARGTAKLFPARYSLVDFGTGFMRLAIKAGAPIVPFGFIGGGAAFPTIANLYGVGRAFGVPYLPLTAYGLPLPLPVTLEVHYGAPLRFEGTGSEDDEAVAANVAQVKARISALIELGRARAKEVHP